MCAEMLDEVDLHNPMLPESSSRNVKTAIDVTHLKCWADELMHAEHSKANVLQPAPAWRAAGEGDSGEQRPQGAVRTKPLSLNLSELGPCRVAFAGSTRTNRPLLLVL